MGTKRIQLIRETVENLNNVKKDGLDLLKDYEAKTLIYDKKRCKFGRVIINTKHYFTVKFKSDYITYFRKSGWKPGKEKFLEDNFRKMTNKELAKVLTCSEKIIEKKLSKLNLKRNFEWDEEKDQFLIKNIDRPNQWLADQLNTTLSSIKGRIYRLKTKGCIPASGKRVVFHWSQEADDFLLGNLDRSNQWLADHFEIKVSSIKSRLRKLREMGLITSNRKRGRKRKA
ncbi:hypothetical protein ACFL27_06810 [candidate division CSSED10-310 bacterium]|uniref:Uncharacterized protein n=1 Tax=candidate division CSSED10-310 bacterium TaxID=2855610 RepID=A0ABV6YUP2_UNCC1